MAEAQRAGMDAMAQIGRSYMETLSKIPTIGHITY